MFSQTEELMGFGSLSRCSGKYLFIYLFGCQKSERVISVWFTSLEQNSELLTKTGRKFI